MIEEAIILAGGMGTRLKDTVKDLPKPMAPVNNKPFLSYLLDYLSYYKLRKVILSIGYKSESIIQYFGYQFGSMELKYAIETEPLGTGGGMLLAMDQAISSDMLVLNGDTFFNVPLSDFYAFHIAMQADITLALKSMKQFDRYGAVVMQNYRISAFNEKKWVAEGLINGGCYLLNRSIFNDYQKGSAFSFEKEILEKNISRLNMAGFVNEGYFVDIGIPEDYARACRESELLRVFV